MFYELLYYLGVVADQLSWEDMAQAAARAGLGKEVFMGLAERTREEGRQEGRKEGRQEGILRGREAAVRMIDLTLVNRFRLGPGLVVPKLEKVGSIERLEALFQVALTAQTLEEFLAAVEAEPASGAGPA